MQILKSVRWFVYGVLMMAAPPAHAEDFRLAMATDDDQYVAEIVELALAEADGDHTLELVGRVILAQNRALRALSEERPRYDMHYSGYDADREQELAMVRFPITMGMLGHRLLAVTEANKDLFANVQTLEDLKQVAVLGSGIDWPDTKILKAAGLTVATASDNNLWQMLARGRFNAFPRGVNEILPEVEGANTGWLGSTVVIDRHVMLVYKYDHFFYFSKANAHKAAIVEQGLIRAHENGKLQALLNDVPQLHAVREELSRHPRRVIRLVNPLLSDKLRALPQSYWHTYP
ncbi:MULTISPECIES: hypothetical protein [Kordiimonas]|jgi:hypothetical protein|nr:MULTISPECIES: hypothetical protein [Kordiimonas]